MRGAHEGSTQHSIARNELVVCGFTYHLSTSHDSHSHVLQLLFAAGKLLRCHHDHDDVMSLMSAPRYWAKWLRSASRHKHLDHAGIEDEIVQKKRKGESLFRATQSGK